MPTPIESPFEKLLVKIVTDGVAFTPSVVLRCASPGDRVDA